MTKGIRIEVPIEVHKKLAVKAILDNEVGVATLASKLFIEWFEQNEKKKH